MTYGVKEPLLTSSSRELGSRALMSSSGVVGGERGLLPLLLWSTHDISMLFSATLSYRAKELAWEFMNNPVEIEIASENITVDRISQKLYHVGKEEKIKLLLVLFTR